MAAMRCAMALRMRSATPGIRLSMARSCEPVSTTRLIGVEATTLATRRSPASSPISPKKSPGPSAAACRSPSLTSAVPALMAKNS